MENSLIKRGIIGELKVKAKLLGLGYNVFQNVCDDNGIDLIIEKNGIYKKIQVKTATKTKKISNNYNRLSFGLGNSNESPDFFICVYLNEYWIIPKKIMNSKAFTIYPNGKRCKFDKLKNQWQLLDSENIDKDIWEIKQNLLEINLLLTKRVIFPVQLPIFIPIFSLNCLAVNHFPLWFSKNSRTSPWLI